MIKIRILTLFWHWSWPIGTHCRSWAPAWSYSHLHQLSWRVERNFQPNSANSQAQLATFLLLQSLEFHSNISGGQTKLFNHLFVHQQFPWGSQSWMGLLTYKLTCCFLHLMLQNIFSQNVYQHWGRFWQRWFRHY